MSPQTRAQRFVRCPKCAKESISVAVTFKPGWGRSHGRGNRTSTYSRPPSYAFEGITPTGRDNRKQSFRGTTDRAKVEVSHMHCGYTWWTMDRGMIQRVRRP